MSAAVDLVDVGMRFRRTAALERVTASFHTGTITGLLGRNGAGKTTLLQDFAGHRLPTSGRVQVFGAAPFENADLTGRLCFVREAQRYPDFFTVRSALSAGELLYPSWDGELAEELLAEFELPARRPIRKLSRGMTAAVGIVIGLASRAPLTVFDEPTLGLDAVARQTFYERLLADYAAHPRTVVLSTHLIEEVAGVLERVVVLDRGRLLLDDDVEALRERTVEVSGPTDAVRAACRDGDVLHEESLAGTSRALLRLPDPPQPRPLLAGVSVTRPQLQEVVVAMTRASSAARPGSAALEEVR